MSSEKETLAEFFLNKYDQITGKDLSEEDERRQGWQIGQTF